MTPHYINPKKAQRAERTREILEEIGNAKTPKEISELVVIYHAERNWKPVRKALTAAIKRINAIKINQSFYLS